MTNGCTTSRPPPLPLPCEGPLDGLFLARPASFASRLAAVSILFGGCFSGRKDEQRFYANDYYSLRGANFKFWQIIYVLGFSCLFWLGWAVSMKDNGGPKTASNFKNVNERVNII